MKRVVITGLGLLTSIGEGVEETWSNLLSTKSGIQKISSFEDVNKILYYNNIEKLL